MNNQEESKFFDDFLNEMMTANLQAQGKMSIVEFANRIIFNNASNVSLYPTQRAILKAFYNEPMDEEEKAIIQGWVDEDRSTWVEGRHYISLVLEAGRRASKCNSEHAYIQTTKGELTYRELHHYVSKGHEIGIVTYDLRNKIVGREITYDIKTEMQAPEPVYEVITYSGKTEITNRQHPYYVWNKFEPKPKWVKLEDLKVGDFIATSKALPIFGTETMPELELEMIAFYMTLTPRHGKLITKLKKRDAYKVLNKYFEAYDYQYNAGSITFISEKSQQFIKNIDLNKLGALDKEHMTLFLKYIAKYGHQIRPKEYDTRIDLLVYKYSDFIRRQLVKLGIYGVKKKDKVGIRNNKDSAVFFSIFGWDVFNPYSAATQVDFGNAVTYYPDHLPHGARSAFKGKLSQKDRLVAPVARKRVHNVALQHDDVYYLDMATNDIVWEPVISIEKKGKARTVAVEVADTHVIGGEIITHNSTMASIIALKEFYDLIILDDPQTTWGLFPGSPIAILVMAQSQAQVKETIFAAIRGYAQQSNYFTALQDQGKIEILAEEIRCSEKNVAIYAKHTNSKSLVGYTLKCMLLDEVARFETVGEEGKNKAFEIWRNVAVGGAAFQESFKKVAISSAWEPGDPIEVLYEDSKKDTNTLGLKLTTFQVNLQLIKGVTPVVVSDYNTDFVKARREYEGIRFSKFNTFINIEHLERNAIGPSCIDAQPSKIDIKNAAGERYYAGVDIIRMAENPNPEEVSFVHVDPALKKDSAALAIARPHKRERDNKWCIHVDALLKWEPHTDNTGLRRIVSYIDIEEKLFEICPARKVIRVTFDQWNSASFIQKLHASGIDSQQVSCSREMQFAYYTLFRDLLAHDYIILPRDSLWTRNAIVELSELVLKPNRQIIHPYAGKDLADAIVNAVYQCHQYMVRTGLNITTGLNTGVASSQRLAAVTRFDANSKNRIGIGSAIDKLYKHKNR